MKIIALLVAVPFLWATVATAQTPPTKVTGTSTATSTTVHTKKGLFGETSTVTQTKAKGIATVVVPGVPAPKVAAPLSAAAPKTQPASEKPKPAVSAQRQRRYERFDVGNKSPTDLKVKIIASLARKSDGSDKIDPAHCQPNGDSCATPQMYLEMFKRADPAAKLTSVSQLPEYLGKLVITDAPKGEFWMACIVRATKLAKWNCMSRQFHPGEHAWKNPLTGMVVLAEDCTNPVGERIPERNCDEIHFWLNAGDEVHIGLLGPEDVPNDVCRPALHKASMPMGEWSLALLDECLRMNCDYNGPSRDLGLPIRREPRISFQAEVTGEYILRVPRFVEKSDDVFVFCVLWPDGTQSMSTYIKKTAYASFGWSYIDYTGNRALSTAARTKNGWRGLVHTWQQSDQRAFKGTRPPVE